MSARELIALGTASQVPTRHRNHNGYLLRWDDEGFLFDPGEGTQRQMIYANVTTSAITRICITHFHGDHCLGLAGISQRISLDRVPHVVHIYYPGSGQKFYERLRHASIFHDVARVEAHPISGPGELLRDNKLTLSTLELDHGVEAWGYRLQEHDSRTMLPDRLAEAGVRGPQIRKLMQDGEITIDGRTITLDQVSNFKKGQSVAFVMDTRVCDNAVALARDVDLLICESTYLSEDADKAHDNGHLTAAEAARIAEAAGARKLVLTHFSQRYTSVEPFVTEAREFFAGEIVAAHDGDTIAVPARQG